MNFVAEVLTSAGEIQMANLKEKIPKIVSQIGKFKSQVVNYMKDINIDFKFMKNKNNNLLNEANKLNSELQELTASIDNLMKRDVSDSKLELENLYADLNESTYAHNLVTQLVEIDTYFKIAKDCFAKKLYMEAITNIDLANKALKNIPSDELLDIIQALIISVDIEHQSILNETVKVWHESVSTDKKVDDDKIYLSIKINASRSGELHESIMALCYVNPFFFELQQLSNFLIKEIFTSIINNNCIVEVNENLHKVLTITVNKSLPKQSYEQVFNNLRNVFEFISVTINFEVKKELYLLGFVGQKISKQFCELLIKNCLADTIPSTPEGLKKYELIANEIELLQEMFIECQFFNKDNESILEYAKNVDVLFANKACQVYLEKAEIILKKDLHDMIEINVKDSNAENIYPKCFISKNVIEYLDLIRQILDQASKSSDMCAGRLVFTADKIIRLYYKLIPEYHKKLLETIPQQVALFHNNCMYIEHELFTLNQYRKEKVKIALNDENFSSHFQQIRVIGTEHFLKYIQLQVKQIEDILKESEFSKLGDTDKLDPNCEKYIRQCLRQLELLKTVWQKVLSYEIYNKTIGELLNSFVKFLIKLIVNVEDISADNCTLLVDVFGIVKTRGPKLFTEPKEINLYTKQWYKFNELILLLNSNLNDINDRWADGKGPLAVEFKPDEVKRLIRALFQNTDRRSAILARIN